MPLFGTQEITTALTGEVVATKTGFTGKSWVAFELIFTYGSGGTDVDVDMETSLDEGSTWIKIARFNETTSTDRAYMTCLAAAAVSSAVSISAAPSDNTARSGILGDRLRMVVTSTGTYAGSTSVRVNYFSG
ncbi:hypothetical protein [Thalassobaculum litoreum]|uniref:Uncharacterized protein n=1 Tax=Thalassobaculum litoreum DSM 18839 TaxID=1123362 RepID=A0A8G2BI27_9PROT|nr:hypothetical protein [Thalassobaculum litoreum]SDF83779.1 hypothetical protein SAMN05660686_02482 [Thalassobaculum litoreum DSM 18839]